MPDLPRPEYKDNDERQYGELSRSVVATRDATSVDPPAIFVGQKTQLAVHFLLSCFLSQIETQHAASLPPAFCLLTFFCNSQLLCLDAPNPQSSQRLWPDCISKVSTFASLP